ncbi:hypothetical protein [Rubritalea tangerina]
MATQHEKLDKKYLDIGLAHLGYRADTSYGAHWLAGYLGTLEAEPLEGESLVKFVAACEWAMQRNHGEWKKVEAMWLKRVEKNIDEEVRGKVRELLQDGYPHSEKYRRAAFKKLQEYGHIPASYEFDSKTPPDFSISSVCTEGGILTLVDDALEGGVATANILSKYLGRKEMSTHELQHLCRLLIEDDDRLRAVLQEFKSGEFKGQVEEILLSLDREGRCDQGQNAFGAVMGWQILFDGETATSLPMICSIKGGWADQNKGFIEGDVIESFHGVSLKGRNSRNLFMRLIQLWPRGEDAQLHIGRSQCGIKGAFDSNLKTKKRKLILNLQ